MKNVTQYTQNLNETESETFPITVFFDTESDTFTIPKQILFSIPKFFDSESETTKKKWKNLDTNKFAKPKCHTLVGWGSEPLLALNQSILNYKSYYGDRVTFCWEREVLKTVAFSRGVAF